MNDKNIYLYRAINQWGNNRQMTSFLYGKQSKTVLCFYRGLFVGNIYIN